MIHLVNAIAITNHMNVVVKNKWDIIKMDENTFKTISDINEIIKYDGFIAPDGSFYKVSIKNRHNPTHIEWAEEYVKRKLDYVKRLANPSGSLLYIISRLDNKQDVLVHFYGYVYYGHDAASRKPIIIYPDRAINEREITEEQLNTLFNILRKNDEFNDFYISHEEKINHDRHERYVDGFISREMEIKK